MDLIAFDMAPTLKAALVRLPSRFNVCGSYISSGPHACDGLRVATPYLDAAVVDGIQKRIGRLLNRDLLASRLHELLRTEADAGDTIEALEDRLTTIRRRISRLVESLADGAGDFPSVRSRLGELEAEQRALEAQLARAQTRATPDAGSLEATADELIGALRDLPAVLQAGEPDERKAVVRAFL